MFLSSPKTRVGRKEALFSDRRSYSACFKSGFVSAYLYVFIVRIESILYYLQVKKITCRRKEGISYTIYNISTNTVLNSFITPSNIREKKNNFNFLWNKENDIFFQFFIQTWIVFKFWPRFSCNFWTIHALFE